MPVGAEGRQVGRTRSWGRGINVAGSLSQEFDWKDVKNKHGITTNGGVETKKP